MKNSTITADTPILNYDRAAVRMNGMIKQVLDDIRERVAVAGTELVGVDQGMRLTEEQRLLHGALAYSLGHVSQEILVMRGLSIDDRAAIDRMAEHVGQLSIHVDRLETQVQSFLALLQRKQPQRRAA